MMVSTVAGTKLDAEVVQRYFRRLVDMFFKIIPMREEKEPSLKTYMESLRGELLGCKSLIHEVGSNPSFLSLIAILQYLIDNVENEEVSFIRLRREVFRAISICNKLEAEYSV